MACADQRRRDLQRLAQMVLGAQQGLVLQLDGACELEHLRIARRPLEHLLNQLGGFLVVVADVGELGIEIIRLKVIRVDLAQRLELCRGCRDVALAEKRIDERNVRGEIFRIDGQGFSVFLDGGLGIGFRVQQQQAPENQRFCVVGFQGENLVDRRKRLVEVLIACLQACFEEQRGRVAGRQIERRLHRGACLEGVLLRGVGDGDGGFQVGRRLAVGQKKRTEFTGDRAIVATGIERSGDQRHHFRRRVFESLHLAQLDERRARVSVLEQRLAEKKARLGRIGILLQDVLELDDSRRAVFVRQIALGRREHAVGALAAAARQQGSGANQGENRAGEGGFHEINAMQDCPAPAYAPRRTGASGRKHSRRDTDFKETDRRTPPGGSPERAL